MSLVTVSEIGEVDRLSLEPCVSERDSLSRDRSIGAFSPTLTEYSDYSPTRDREVRSPASPFGYVRSPPPRRRLSRRSPLREDRTASPVRRAQSPDRRGHIHLPRRSRSPVRRSRSPRRRARSDSRNSETLSRHSRRHRSRSPETNVIDQLAKWMAKGLPPGEAKTTRSKYDCSFTIPKVDEFLSRRLQSIKAKEKSSGSSPQWSIDIVEKNLSANQYKILDIVKPSLRLWSSSPSADAKEDIEAALRLWATSFNDVTKQRRKNILRATNPNLLPLLKEDSLFSAEESDKLFGRTFLDAMLKEADDEAKFNLMGRAGGPSSNPKRGFFNRQKSGRSSGAGPSQSHRGGYHDYNNNRGFNYRYTLSAPPCLEYDPTLIGGRLSLFANQWATISRDPWILDTIKFGLRIEFWESPVQSSPPRQITMSTPMAETCDEEVRDLIKKGAIRELDFQNSNGGFVSSIFVVPKSNGGFRPIINLSYLNYFVTYHHFKMEGLEDVRYLIQQGDWMAKIDIKDAYLNVPIHPDHWQFLRFHWKGSLFEFSCLPFGLTSAPRVSTKILKPVVMWLRKQGIRLVIYLDDIIIFGESRAIASSNVEKTTDLLHSLGFCLNEKKCQLEPATSIEYLGVIINSRDLSFSLPEKKINNIRGICQRMISKLCVSLREILSILGHLSWAVTCVPFAESHYRQIQSFILEKSRSSNGNLDRKVPISASVIEDLNWWVNHLSSVNGKKLSLQIPDITIFSDASLTGWGGYSNGIRVQGPWPKELRSSHINELELQAALYSLKSFTSGSRSLNVSLFLDNTTAVACVNKGGGTRSRSLNKIAIELQNWCEERALSITAAHLPGKLYSIADHESRVRNDSSDWQLSPTMFQRIAMKWPVEIDLFAMFWNRQLPTFVSWKPQPEALATNAFSMNWNGFLGYAFPPFALVSRCLEKIRREAAELVLITPVWPGQPWHPAVMRMVCDVSLLLQPQKDLLPSSEGKFHPLARSLLLCA